MTAIVTPFTYNMRRQFTTQHLVSILESCRFLDYMDERLVGGILLELTQPSKRCLFFFSDVLSLLETCAHFELQEIEFLNHLAERVMDSIPYRQLP